MKKKEKTNMKKQWLKFIVVLVLWLLFIYWLRSWLGLIVVPFIYDVYISKKINWQWKSTGSGGKRLKAPCALSCRGSTPSSSHL